MTNQDCNFAFSGHLSLASIYNRPFVVPPFALLQIAMRTSTFILLSGLNICNESLQCTLQVPRTD